MINLVNFYFELIHGFDSIKIQDHTRMDMYITDAIVLINTCMYG